MQNDVWNESDDEFEKTIAEKSWKQMQNKMGIIGYKNGISQGKELYLQNGFDEGFKLASFIGLELGKMQGVLSSLIAYYNNDPSRIEMHKLQSELMEFKFIDSESSKFEFELLKSRFNGIMDHLKL